MIFSLQLVCSDSVGAFTCQDKLNLCSDILLPWVEEILLGEYKETDVLVYGDPQPSVVSDDLSLSSDALLELICLENSSLVSFFHWYLTRGSSGGLLSIEFSLKWNLMRS